MALNCVDHLWVATQAAEDLPPDQGVGPLHLGIHRLADVVEHPGLLGEMLIGPDLGRDHAGEVGHLLDMGQHVLSVAVAEAEGPDQLDQLGMDAL